MSLRYDIVVIGAGHAGCEAASAAAHLGSRTLLITIDMDKIAAMSCNPAVGGVAKGQIVREIDALGGMMGRITDMSAIQFRMLNRSRVLLCGAHVRSAIRLSSRAYGVEALKIRLISICGRTLLSIYSLLTMVRKRV